MAEEIETAKASLHDRSTGEGWQEQWKEAFSNCFLKVDAEIGGAPKGTNVSNTCTSGDYDLQPIAPETVGSTAVVTVICPTHIIVANCGDSRAVLCRGKVAVPLSVDHNVRPLIYIVPLYHVPYTCARKMQKSLCIFLVSTLHLLRKMYSITNLLLFSCHYNVS